MKICLICARKGSKGVPGKHLVQIDGKSLLENTINQAKESREFDSILFSSNDEVLLTIANKIPFVEIIKRPDNLATSNSSKWEVFRHAVEFFETKNVLMPTDIICDLDISVPYRSVSDIKNVIKEYQNEGVLVTAYESERNPYFNMVQFDEKNESYSVVMKNQNSNVQNRQEAKEVFSLSSSIFCFNKETLFKYNHWSECKLDIYKIPRKRGFDLDNKEDLEYYEATQK